MEFRQNTIGQIIDSERDMILTAPARYGKHYDSALECSLLLTQFLKSVDADRWIFGSFLSLAKKHHTLALFSLLRLHKVQAMLNLRQTLEAGACAAFAIAHPGHEHFVVADEHDILDPVSAGKRYTWLDKNYNAGSTRIKEIKQQINSSTAHANLISTHNTFRIEREDGWFSAPFFDLEDEHFVKVDLWMISDVAITLMHYFNEINEERSVLKFVDNFDYLIQKVVQQNSELRTELMSTDRHKRATEKDKMRQKPASS